MKSTLQAALILMLVVPAFGKKHQAPVAEPVIAPAPIVYSLTGQIAVVIVPSNADASVDGHSVYCNVSDASAVCSALPTRIEVTLADGTKHGVYGTSGPLHTFVRSHLDGGTMTFSYRLGYTDDYCVQNHAGERAETCYRLFSQLKDGQ